MTAAFAGANAAALMATVLRDRRTVRITYYRESDILSLDVMRGERVEQHVLALALNSNSVDGLYDIRESMESAIERSAERVAQCHGLDITRLDVD